MTTREEAILWLNSFVKNKESMTLIPKQLIKLMHEALTEQPEIVRCKDCRQNNQCSIQFKFACADNPGEWFCAYGKRRET